MELDPLDVAGYHALFLMHYHLGEFGRFRAAADTALRLNPNYPDMLADLAVCTAFTRDWDEGLRIMARALRLSPHPPGWYHWLSAWRLYLDDRHEEALTQVHLGGKSAWGFEILFEAMVLGQLGRVEEARPLVDVIEADPDRFRHLVSHNFRLWHAPEELTAKMRDGWRKAGITTEL